MVIVNPDWVPPIEITFDEGKPIRSEQGLMLAGNPIAAFLGKPGAVRLLLSALERLEPGGQIRSRNDTEVTSESLDGVVAHEFGFIQFGTIRVRAEKMNENGELAFVRIRNGVATDMKVSTGAGVVTDDIAVQPGDTLQIIARRGSGLVATIRNARFQTAGQDLWPGPLYVRVEGNRAAP